VGACAGGDLAASEHPRQLLHPFLLVEAPDLRRGAPAARALLHQEVSVREGRELGQVGDAQDLAAGRGLAQALPDRDGDRAADPASTSSKT
jgi:hypothetical protein